MNLESGETQKAQAFQAPNAIDRRKRYTKVATFFDGARAGRYRAWSNRALNQSQGIAPPNKPQ